MGRLFSSLYAVLLLFAAGATPAHAEPGAVTLWRLPQGAIQPQAAVDSKGVVHLVFFQGDPMAGDLFYLRMTAEQERLTEPIRVNSEPHSASAIGTIRCEQIALGKDDRVHVVWNGVGPKESMAYTRLNDQGTAFEPQRNLLTWATGLDGGGSVAADRAGNVYAVWHALAGAKDEAGRAVFVAVSRDNGKTFAREKQANPEPTGACGCCGLRAFADSKGFLYVLYRAAGNHVVRDTMLLVSRDRGRTFQEKHLDPWNIDT